MLTFLAKSWVTNIVDRATNRVQAVLKITNAKVEDAGVYKCIVKVQDKSTYKKTRIRVYGKFALLFASRINLVLKYR